LIPLAPSFDHAGPIARSAADVALLYSAMALDGEKRGYVRRPRRGPKPLAGLRIGIPDQTFGNVGPAPGIAQVTEEFAVELRKLGARTITVKAPRSQAENLSSPGGFAFFLTVVGAEVDAYHRRYYPARLADYTPDVAFTLSLMRAANTVPADPAVGRAVVDQLTADWRRAFKDSRVDAVLQPAAVIETPRRSDAMLATQSIGDPMVVWDYTGFPSLCLPAGLSPDTGLPVGVQLAGLPGRERQLLGIGIDAQAHFPHHAERPPGA
jgi:aspartyl-tRNA(Asn)/glutamyl-tRNA(Gln) amidotransferase subunit A